MTREAPISRPPLRLHDLHPSAGDMRAEILAGLHREPKELPCKYLYDDAGSRLFEQICELDEYYPTRTEVGILHRHAEEIAQRIGPQALLIELGSGSSAKTHILLRALAEPAGYVPVDIAREPLRAAAERVAGAFPAIPIFPLCADFNAPFSLPPGAGTARKRFVFFPGSTIGNFAPSNRRKLLSQIAELCQSEGGGLLVGIDLLKDAALLEPAYDDAAGVTAAFNRNLLVRINRELGANFDVAAFAHRATFNPDQERVEIHLVSRADQHVVIDGQSIGFARGEAICTEHCYKFSVSGFADLAAEAGLALDGVWTDEAAWFAVLLLRTR